MNTKLRLGALTAAIVIPAQPASAQVLSPPPGLGMDDASWQTLREGTLGYDLQDGTTALIATDLIGGENVSGVPPAAGQPHAQVRVLYNTGDFTAGPCQYSTAVRVEVEGVAPPATGVPSPGPVRTDVIFAVTGNWIESSTLFESVDTVVRVEDSTTSSDCSIGAGASDGVTLEWFVGGQQELDILGIPVGNINNQTDCEGGDYYAYFNGRFAELVWEPATGLCVAQYVGLYFPAEPGYAADDFYLWSTHYQDVDAPEMNADYMLALDHEFGGNASLQIPPYPYLGRFFDSGDSWDDIRVRPLLVELATLANGSEEIIDRARIMFWGDVEESMEMFGDQQVPGADAILTVSGLDALEPTHFAQLPYPSLQDWNDGFETLLRGQPWNDFGGFASSASIALEDLPVDDIDYFRKGEYPSGANAIEWEGSAAYKALEGDVDARFTNYWTEVTTTCGLPSNPGWGACAAPIRNDHCINIPFSWHRIEVQADGVTSRFRQDLPHEISGLDQAAWGGDGVDLEFRDAPFVGVSSTKTLTDLDVVLEGDLMPHVQLVYRPGPTCLPAASNGPPDDQRLEDQTPADSDEWGWAWCEELKLESPSTDVSTLFSFSRSPTTPESIDTLHVETTVVPWNPSHGFPFAAGTCAQAWLQPDVDTHMNNWHATIDGATDEQWSLVEGETETVDRLFSALELGIEDVDSGLSPAFSLYETGNYDLEALIQVTPADTIDLSTSSVDGMYVPYLTRAIAHFPGPVYQKWPCFAETGQSECGRQPWVHPYSFPDGGVDMYGTGYDTSHGVTHMLFNQVLWAQAHDPAYLGYDLDPVISGLGATALNVAHAGPNVLFDDHPSGFEIRWYATQSPYIITPDNGDPASDDTFVAPQFIVELYDINNVTGDPVTRFTVDIHDRDINLFGIDSDLYVGSNWSTALVEEVTTVSYYEGCWGQLKSQGGGCAGEVETTILTEVVPEIEAMLDVMLGDLPQHGAWDAGGESAVPSYGVPRPSQFGNSYETRFYGDLQP